jgi:hypothetical protein
MCKKKAEALSLRQDEVISSLNQNTQKTIEALLETRNMVREDLLSHTEDITRKTVANHVEMQPSMLRTLGDAQSIEIDMLQNLRFAAIEDRHQAIPAAHQKTFRWDI